MLDVHCHLQFHSFNEDYDLVAKRAFATGVTGIINVGTRLDSSELAVNLAEKYKEMYAVIGIHPHHADKIGDDWLNRIEDLGKNEKVIGIGEIGLDYYSYKSNGIVDPEIQKHLFIEQIKIASRLGLPLQIHNRHAGEDIIAVIKQYRKLLPEVPGMFHCFAGSQDVLSSALELGFYIGYDGNITYKGLAPGENTALPELALKTPLNRLLIETDSPFLTPIPYRGERNEPKNVITTGKFIAELKGISYDYLDDQVTRNAYKVFPRLG